MNIFRRPDYTSEATLFLRQLIKSKPELEAQQRQGRALLWDKELDHAANADMRAGRVPQKPYVYQTDPK